MSLFSAIFESLLLLPHFKKDLVQPVLVCLCFCITNTIARVAYEQQKFISYTSEDRRSKIKAPADSLSGLEIKFLVRRCHLPVSSLVRRGEGATWDLSLALIPFMRLHPHDLITPKTPPPTTIALGIRSHHMNILGT